MVEGNSAAKDRGRGELTGTARFAEGAVVVEDRVAAKIRGHVLIVQRGPRTIVENCGAAANPNPPVIPHHRAVVRQHRAVQIVIIWGAQIQRAPSGQCQDPTQGTARPAKGPAQHRIGIAVERAAIHRKRPARVHRHRAIQQQRLAGERERHRSRTAVAQNDRTGARRARQRDGHPRVGNDGGVVGARHDIGTPIGRRVPRATGGVGP